MGQESPTTVLGNDIEARIAELSRKRLRDKRKGFGLKMGAAILGAAVTVLLGVKVSTELETTFKNTALIAGALVAVLNAWDAFYDHKGLWVKRTTTVARLKKLHRAFRIASAVKQDLAPTDVENFRVILDQILDDDLSSWVQLRTDSSGSKGAAIGGRAA